ncbi:hypothetical protein H7849_01890 [Alloacidobacterium dinghuense]|uniref:Type II toxin-antitoxin system HicB family antitoxin n=1 Tax=Alloacidobacterium dinghuense TaxID=2763107 RepID=A0A7G8BJQ6_9BACT|nr:hypothetical protein [Alloacidobacterium dinghuense]QNI32776.1 hypothetical protein H7849_01890 [Alloacidobacterium dinghuense]
MTEALGATVEQPTESVPVLEGSSVAHCNGCGKALLRLPEINNPKLDSSLYNLRCFGWRESEHLYVAECIDLDITAEGKTEDEAIAGLQDAMSGYLAVFFEGVETDETMALESVLRPSPLIHRIKYAVGLWLLYRLPILLFRRKQHRKTFFKVPSWMVSSHCA